MTTLIAVYNSEGCVGRCDARCYDAAEELCDCICGGRNHGTGKQQAVDNTRELAESWLEQARASGQNITHAEMAIDAMHEPLFEFERCGHDEIERCCDPGKKDAMNGDKLTCWTAVAAGIAVAAVAAGISYRHAVTVVTSHGEPGIVGHLYPVVIDGLIVAASMVLLDAARHQEKPPALAVWLLAAGIGATLAANVLAGVSAGLLGAIVAAWPALGFVGCYELLMLLVRASAKRNVQAPAGEPQGSPDAPWHPVPADAQSAALTCLEGHHRRGQPAVRPATRNALWSQQVRGHQGASGGGRRGERTSPRGIRGGARAGPVTASSPARRSTAKKNDRAGATDYPRKEAVLAYRIRRGRSGVSGGFVASAVLASVVLAAHGVHPAAGRAQLSRYVNPLAGEQWQDARTDQGVDYFPVVPEPVRAIGAGTIVFSSTSTGWPGGTFISYRLAGGPAAGHVVYVAEHLSGLLPEGATVSAGSTIASAWPGYPWTEWGWACSGGDLPAVQYDGAPDGTPMAGGLAFARLMRSLGAGTAEDPGPGPDRVGAY